MPAPRHIIMIIGPTACGKTAVACALADRLRERRAVSLISVDSAMVYRGMDIGSAKPTPTELVTYPHALIDIREPEQTYTAADFVADADQQVQTALAAGRLPVLVGGTMLYAHCFARGLATLPPADPDLRARLTQDLVRRGADQLHAELSLLDPQAAANIHPHNRQRLVRALEVIALTGRPMSEQWQAQHGLPVQQRLQARLHTYAILPQQRALLHRLIEARFDEMLQAGFVAELERLRARPAFDADLPALRAVGYRQGLAFLAGTIDEDAFRHQALTATRRLAKRQLTWLRKWSDLTALAMDAPAALAETIERDLKALI